MKRWDEKQAKERLRELREQGEFHRGFTGHRVVVLDSPPTVTCTECSYLERLTVFYHPLEGLRKYLRQSRKELDAWEAAPRTEAHVGGRDTFVKTDEGRCLPTPEVVGPDGRSSVPIERCTYTGWPEVFQADGSFLGYLRFFDGQAYIATTAQGVSLFSVEDHSGAWHFPTHPASAVRVHPSEPKLDYTDSLGDGLPSRTFLILVMFIAATREKLPLRYQGVLSEGLGVYCVRRHLPGGAVLCQAGGKYRIRLSFTVDKSGIVVTTYQPGDWEQRILESALRAARLVKGMGLGLSPEGLEG